MLARAFRAHFHSTGQKSPGNYMELPCHFSGYPKTYGVLLILLVGISVSSAFTPLSLSDGRVESKISSNGRHLLQAKKGNDHYPPLFFLMSPLHIDANLVISRYFC